MLNRYVRYHVYTRFQSPVCLQLTRHNHFLPDDLQDAFEVELHVSMVQEHLDITMRQSCDRVQ